MQTIAVTFEKRITIGGEPVEIRDGLTFSDYFSAARWAKAIRSQVNGSITIHDVTVWCQRSTARMFIRRWSGIED